MQTSECPAAVMGGAAQRAAAAVEQRVMSQLLNQSMGMAKAVGDKVPWPQFAGFYFGGLAGVMFINHMFVSEVKDSLNRDNRRLTERLDRAEKAYYNLK